MKKTVSGISDSELCGNVLFSVLYITVLSIQPFALACGISLNLNVTLVAI